ncbi:hypothetical protein [Geosporobacter ferrireducens]|uniref:hypothetical protein n=1 Tax=Geosporobacter ferrireducens TaxID=1424294 RepID=UPI002356F79D|nr:hypothetical protein [Geosporobacter ferrireducens]
MENQSRRCLIISSPVAALAVAAAWLAAVVGEPVEIVVFELAERWFELALAVVQPAVNVVAPVEQLEDLLPVLLVELPAMLAG